MAMIEGGNVINDSTKIEGSKERVYHVNGVPTDTNLGYDGTPPDGTLADNVLTGNVYERQLGVWTRIDTV